ncbi:hypothetical protein [Streptomyces sp. NPDC057293]|uniref:effector-associated constant component EACC1 n=1 Tax=unclassified Streptomyces TaxID=2593676 RepID=UPI00363210D1
MFCGALGDKVPVSEVSQGEEFAVVEVSIQPGTGRYGEGSQAWRDQVATLYVLLSEEAGAPARGGVPAPGQKGAVEATALALGSSGALTAAVTCFRAWLARDKTRTLTITWTDVTGAEQRLHVSGDNIDQASFQALVESLENRMGHD